MRNLNRCLVMGASLAVFVIMIGALCADAATLRLAYVAPIGTINHEVGEKFKAEVEKLSGGELTVDLFPGGQLGNLPQMFGQLKKGSIDLFKTDVGVVALVGGGKALGVVFAPYLFRDQEHFEKFSQSDIFRELMSPIEQNAGIRFVELLGDRSPRALTTRSKLVFVPDDTKGQKIRTPTVTSIDKVIASWGASLAVVPAAEIYSSLKQKVVDGQENGIDVVAGMKLWEVQTFFTATDHIRSAEALYANQAKWDSLSDQQRNWVTEGARLARKWGNDRLRDMTFLWLEECRANGMTIVMPPLDPWVKTSLKVLAELEGKEWPEGLYQRIQAIK